MSDAVSTREVGEGAISSNVVYGVTVGVGSAFPSRVYQQAETKALFGIQNPVVNKLMDSGHIETRHLYLPEPNPETGVLPYETHADLRKKFLAGIEDMGVRAARAALESAAVAPEEVGQIIGVTSAGLTTPGVSSIVGRALGLRSNLHRLDVVGMGCNAGMSALYSAATAVKADTDLTTLLVCCEPNSAGYVKDETVRTGIVNSLFGDGASAMVLKGARAFAAHQARHDDDVAQVDATNRPPAFSIIDFEAFTIEEHWDAMRYDLNEEQNKLSFLLSPDIPFVVGANMPVPVDILLKRHGVSMDHIDHWVLHSGGGAVIDGARKSLKLSEHQVRHTRSVLRDYGNITSGSFIVSLERLYAEGQVKTGDVAMLMAMGPGATIEAALVKFIA